MLMDGGMKSEHTTFALAFFGLVPEDMLTQGGEVVTSPFPLLYTCHSKCDKFHGFLAHIFKGKPT